MKLGRHPLASGAPEAHAVAWGEDDLGVFTAFSVKGVEQRMRWVPPGHFVMGTPQSEPGRYDSEGPMHRVTLTKGFWLGETPVTQALWTAVMGDNPSHFQGPERPVERVSWDDCQRFLAAVRVAQPVLALRLPTEAEWEFACRAGTIGATWRGGNDASTLDRIAWYDDNSNGQTQPVRSKAPNPLGLHDMLGNVWEWCSDFYGAYPAAAVTDPVDAAASALRVIRGSSWYDPASYVRAGQRNALPPGARDYGLGFRVARGQT